MNNCVFCKIVNGDIPSYTIYEDNIVKAFLDISQVTPGHTLVIPKKHIPNIYEYDSKLAAEIFSRIPKIARAIKKSNPNIKGLNILNNNGKLASQSVFHSHFHLIPRYNQNDDFKMSFKDNTDKYSKDKYQDIMQSIINNIKE